MSWERFRAFAGSTRTWAMGYSPTQSICSSSNWSLFRGGPYEVYRITYLLTAHRVPAEGRRAGWCASRALWQAVVREVSQ